MDPQGKLIFSKRFQRLDLDEPWAETEEDAGEGALPPSSSEFFRKIEESSVYVLRPDKWKGRRRFIDLAKRFSLTYRIDMDIKEYEHSISVILYLFHSVYAGEGKRMLTELVALCDRVSSFPEEGETCEFTLFLDYHTHDYYLAGRKVD